MLFWFLATIVAMILLILSGTALAPRSPGRLSLVLAVCAGLWWIAGVIARHSFDDLEMKLLANRLSWFGIVGVPLFWSLGFVTYARGREREKPWHIGMILLLMAVFQTLALTDGWHHLFFSGVADPEIGLYRHGPIYHFALAFCYAVMAGAFCYGLGRMPGARGLHRWQMLALLAAALLPWAANAAYNFLHFRMFEDDATPFVFVATGGCILLAQVFGRLFVLPPIGRDAIFAMLPDPVIVLDEKGRILEQNPAAGPLTGLAPDAIGARLARPAEIAALIERHELVDGLETEVTIGESGFTYELSCHSLSPWGREGGRMVLLRDVTLRKADQMRLNALSADLQKELENNLELQKRLQDEASRDHLTGLHNRRHAYEGLPGILGRHAQTALIILDIDHFKSFNDRYGHDTGDLVLKAFAGLLARDATGLIRAFRWGGEEFLVVLPGAGSAEALAFCAGWRTAFAATDLGLGDDTALTFSAGIHLVAEEQPDLNDAIKKADIALYEAKRSGRDRALLFASAGLSGSAPASTDAA